MMATRQPKLSNLMTTAPAPKSATNEERANKLYGANPTRVPVLSKRVHQTGADPKRKAMPAKATQTK
jgi:hypothetical protein